MMRFPRNLPIQRKVTLVVLVTTTACLIVACLALFAFQLVNFRRNFVNDLSALSDVVANSSIASVAFNDRDAAVEILSGLKAKPHVRSASIVKDGEVFARFGQAENRPALARYPQATGYVFDGNSLLHSQPIVFDDEPIGMLYVRSDYRTVYLSLLKLYTAILAGVLAVSVGLAWVISMRLQRFVSEPILRLADTARSIAQNKDYSVRVTGSNEDEVGVFTEAFNQMLAQIEAQDSALQSAQLTLENQVKALQREITERQHAEKQLAEAHTQLVETSRQAGMAEVATGVLHNVGNVLNSVNVSATLVSERVRQSKSENLLKASMLLHEHAEHLADFFAHDPRAKLLLDYLPNLGVHLNEERAEMLNELELLTKNLDHIKDIVAMQQSYAKVSGVIEPVSIASLAEDALQINQGALTRHGVEVVRQYADVPAVAVDKHKILQILVNLVRNAMYAMAEHEQPEKRLVISIGLVGSECVRVRVEDNGIGIAPENLVRIFSHGFTTKKEGHGFGLHSCALAARDMDGSLAAESGGLGHGATFTLELPIAAA
ncbi:MAG TPA: ATP-binding protein [Chthoniobacterales bacterium]|nr:ATP-binding protein [Chthoniobacterales bacterium]